MKPLVNNNFFLELENLAKFLEIEIHNKFLYLEAFSHPTYSNENQSNLNYERLEFLGDAVLGFKVSEYLFQTRSSREKELTDIKRKFVLGKAETEYCKEMKLDELILLGQGEKNEHGEKKASILENVFEAFIGALYLDSGMDAVEKILQKWVYPKIENGSKFFTDYKSALQESIQAERDQVPTYYVVNKEGPSHKPIYEIVVKLDDIILGRGKGYSKKEAEQDAAKNALEKLAK